MKDSVGGKARDQKEFENLAGSQQFFIDQGLLSLQISHEIHQFLLDCFTQFFVRNVKNYHRDDLPIHFVGSIAVVYEAELRAAAISLGLIVGRIIKAPLEGLIMYHHPDNHP